MPEYWAREEKVDAIQFRDNDESSLEQAIIWCGDWWEQGVYIQLQAHTAGIKRGGGWHWVTLAGQMEDRETALPEEELTRLNDGDYLVVDEFRKFHVLSEQDFMKKYYRRPLQ